MKQIRDAKNRSLDQGDLVMLMYIDYLDQEDIVHELGDILQFVGGMEDNIGCFIHCRTKKRTDFFADRTLKINQKIK